MSPERNEITLVVDGVEVKAAEGEMLVDAAKGGDVEIPVFCYEPKLVGPVGACRMCLVEIEGIPKLQTACSTPVRDGMVVYTATDRVVEAQDAVVFCIVGRQGAALKLPARARRANTLWSALATLLTPPPRHHAPYA